MIKNKYINNIVWVFGILLLFNSCDNDFDTELNFNAGTELDLTTYVALGNSLTAGFTDGALFISAQDNSYPKMLSDQFKTLGGSKEFNIPYMEDELGGIPSVDVKNKLTFKEDKDGNKELVVAMGEGKTTLANKYKEGEGFHNLGVPGARSFHLDSNEYGNPELLSTFKANPYFVRMASSPTATVVDDALKLNPTFFSLWIGNNDVLGYSTAGGDDGDPTAIITPTASFEQVLTSIVAQMSKNKTVEGVIANIPNVTDIPYFTTITKDNIVLTQEQVNQLNAGYSAYNDGLEQLNKAGLLSSDELSIRKINFEVGPNQPVILDESLTDLTSVNAALVPMRQATEDDLILLVASDELAKGGGTKFPLTDKYVLTQLEKEEATIAVSEYNQIIKNLANEYNLALYDANADLNRLNTTGINVFGTNYNGKFVTNRGNSFSLDGVHPAGQGYAVIANGFIKAINSKYNANIPQVSPKNFAPVPLP